MPAVIFDMDGVLVDSYEAHHESWVRMFAEVGHEYTEEEFAADFGRTNQDILGHRFGDQLTDEQIRDYADRKEAYYRDIIRQDFPALDGAVELLDALAAAGFKLAIGSSGPPENVAVVLEKLGASHFAAKVTGSDVERGKPDPQVFLLAAERLGVPPAECAVVEDAVHGVEAANAAGMASIALIGTATNDELSAANLIVHSLRELTPDRIRQLIENR